MAMRTSELPSTSIWTLVSRGRVSSREAAMETWATARARSWASIVPATAGMTGSAG